MNVCDKRNVNLFLDPADRSRCLHCRNCDTDDVASRLLKCENLSDRRLNILGLRVAHRLDQNRIVSADHAISNMNFFCLHSLCHRLFLPPRFSFPCFLFNIFSTFTFNVFSSLFSTFTVTFFLSIFVTAMTRFSQSSFYLSCKIKTLIG